MAQINEENPTKSEARCTMTESYFAREYMSGNWAQPTVAMVAAVNFALSSKVSFLHAYLYHRPGTIEKRNKKQSG